MGAGMHALHSTRRRAGPATCDGLHPPRPAAPARIATHAAWSGRVAGELIARFRLGEVISESEPATLFAGRDELGGEPVAVALLGRDAVRTPGELRTFQKRVDLAR